MLETSARLLKLLSLLQTHRDWSGSDLAERLGVTQRTVRRDVDRLRELGYPVHATRGSAGYRLGAGAVLPPLLLDDDEAVAIAIGLRTATASSVAGIEETSLRALAKLEQVLPSHLRHRVSTLQQATVRVAATGPRVDPDTLLAISEAVRRRERLRFDYGDVMRTVEPHTLVNFGRHWYLVAWDVDRQDWRTFRIDRLVPKNQTGPRFEPRAAPDGDVTAYLSRRLSTGPWPAKATVTMHLPAEVMAQRVWPGMGFVEPKDDRTCLLHLGAPSYADLAWMVTASGVDFTAAGPPEFADALRALGERCLRAI
jgi:predicted DNA-binding transcriptional regulator YafY